LLAEAGFGDAVREIKRAFDAGGREAAARVVPDELIDAVALAGTPAACRERLAAYRRAGLALPIVSPRVAGPEAKAMAMSAIRACAP
jgi:alkanesulfonate monooxygenase SsuD/methylene tetrahydromethanopterin reductase-like flavin-dependent oxidoreductase (luciferase family)